MSHIISYAFHEDTHKYHQTQADASGNIHTAIRGTWADEMIEDTDQIVSKLTDISTNASLSASRASNIQDWIGTSGGDGTGVKTGVNIASLAGCVSGTELQVDIVSGSVSISGGATESKQDTMETSLNAIETLLTTQATHNTNILTKNGEIDTAVDLTNTKLTTIDGVLDDILTKNTEIDTAIDLTNTKLTTIDTVLDNILVKNTEIDTAIDTQTALTNYMGSQANLMNGVSCVAAGTDSSVIDWGATRGPKRVQITAVATSSTSGTGMEVWGSHDNSTWCVMNQSSGSKTISLHTTESDGSSINSQGGVVMDWCMRYMKIRIYCLAVFTATAIGHI